MSRLIVRSVAVAAIGLGLSGLLLLESSPAFEWLSAHPSVTNVASAVNLPAIILAVVGSGNVHAPGNGWIVGAAVAQWQLYGLLVAWLHAKLWPNKSSKPTPLRGAA